MSHRALLAACLAALPSLGTAAGSAAGTYIISFEEPPLAAFRGFEGDADPARAALKATSPAVTGEARLDVGSAPARAYRAWLGKRREERLAEFAARLGRAPVLEAAFDVVNNAVVLRLEAGEADRIAALPGIALVEPEYVRRPTTDAGPQWIAADRIWSGAAGAATRGAGVVVGVIDTGINRTHPAFAAVGPVDGFVHGNPRGSTYYGLCAASPTLCNAKLIGIHDFTLCTGSHAGQGCDDREPNTGLDPDGHGSHVASTVAGNVLDASLSLATGNVTRRLSGVAPHANVISYKACEEEEDCRASWLLAAINKAVEERVDVLNYSIGGGGTDPWATSDAIGMLNAREAGTVVVVAAGNEGPRSTSVTFPAIAPWVIAVANSSHDRGIVNRIVDLQGGVSPPPSGGVLLGVGSTAGYGPARIVVPLDFPGCSVGSDIDSPPTGASNPWTGRVFNGEIVVCARGTQARVAKSNNVRLAGGGGMILTNTALEGESVVADAHSIPGTHVGQRDGDALRAWLAGGSDHRGRIEGAQVRNEADLADVLASSSGRGPSPVAGSLKPNLAAPGTSIWAAAGTGTGLAFLSGTSMASPHVAGAAALLRALRPTWNVSDIESALVGTARGVVRSSDGSRTATPFEQGAGRVDVAAAAGAGLSFPVSPQDFRNARPSLGGRPETLNQAGIVLSNCFEECRATRRVRDLVGGGRWAVESEMPDGIAVVPSVAEFDIAAGGQQSIEFAFRVEDARLLGQWVPGQVRLRRVGGVAASDSRIPVMLFAAPGPLPARIAVPLSSDRGHVDAPLSGLAALPDLGATTTSLATPVQRSEVMPQDPTNSSVYDSFGTGTFFSLLPLPGSSTPRTYRLLADLTSPTAVDVDLFVGIDANANGRPDEAEELCRSTSPGATERCELDLEAAAVDQVVWVLAQNWQASAQGASDRVTLDSVLVDLAPAVQPQLTVTAPSTLARVEPFALRVAVDAPDLLPGGRRVGFVRLHAAGDAPAPFATLRVEVDRLPASTAGARALVPGRGLAMRLPPGQAADRLFLDVPANAASMTLRSSGSGSDVHLYAARVEAPASPVIAPAPPRAQADASATGSGAERLLQVQGAQLSPGRWYLTPVNAGAGFADFTLTVDIDYAGARAEPRRGAWFNPASDGSGLFLFDVGEAWGLAWYTYLQDGTPTWYLGAAPRPAAQQGLWHVVLQRYRWNGGQAIGTPVGEAVLALDGDSDLGFNWSIDGESGGQRMQWIGDPRCPQGPGGPVDIDGLWFSPERSGFGYSVVSGLDFESIGAYFYDAQGIARWALGSGDALATGSMPLDWRVGSCALCAYQPPLRLNGVGSLTRSYGGTGSGRFGVDFPLPAPLSGRWQVDLPAVRLSSPLACP